MTLPPTIKITRTVDDLRFTVATWRAAGETIALVPTMGALHDGHMALVVQAQKLASKVCVTLFVNPTQFGENEDLENYPRNEEDDIAKLTAAGIDLLYAPHPSQMYGEGDTTRVTVGALGDILEGAHRPGFFTGVATVVTKLLLQALPDFALFGEKDFQQIQVIKRLVHDLNIPVSIEGVPCVREPDGLALSSRNVYLADDERLIAPALYRTMNEMAGNIRNGTTTASASGQAKSTLLGSGFTAIDYIVACKVDDLSEISQFSELNDKPGRIIAAVWLGKTRLIDNIIL
jgi:pantoate--beta-alanine ligase